MTRVVTVTITIPEGVEVRIGGGPPDDGDDEPLPPAPWVTTDEPEPAFRIAAARNGSVAGCPVHRVPWRTVSAGISKKTGRAYAAFQACPEPGCQERPPIARRSVS
jgi:hypothetical protein